MMIIITLFALIILASPLVITIGSIYIIYRYLLFPSQSVNSADISDDSLTDPPEYTIWDIIDEYLFWESIRNLWRR